MTTFFSDTNVAENDPFKTKNVLESPLYFVHKNQPTLFFTFQPYRLLQFSQRSHAKIPKLLFFSFSSFSSFFQSIFYAAARYSQKISLCVKKKTDQNYVTVLDL